MKRRIRVKPFREKWGEQAHLGPHVDWHEIRQVEIGLSLGPAIFGLRFRWGKYLFDECETHRKPEFVVGSNFVFVGTTYRYGRAGEDLKAGTFVESDLAGRLAPVLDPSTITITSELIWGGVKAAKEVDQYGTNILGWPEVNVKKGRYCWFREPPPGVDFIYEKDKTSV